MKICIFWHRRDLRVHDNAGLAAALASGLPVLPLFIYDKRILDYLPEKVEAGGKRHPLQRIGQPEDLAYTASFLLSDHSSFVTGQTLAVDGGMGKLK